MQNITLETHIGADGMLHLDLPVAVKNTALKVTLTFQTPEAPAADDEILVLNNRQRDWFLDLLDNPPEANEALKAAALKYRRHLHRRSR